MVELGHLWIAAISRSELFDDFSSLEVEVVHLRGVFRISENQFRFSVVQDRVRWYDEISRLILQTGQVGIVRQSPLLGLRIGRVLVALDDGPVKEEGPVERMRLKQLPVDVIGIHVGREGQFTFLLDWLFDLRIWLLNFLLFFLIFDQVTKTKLRIE